MKNQTIYLLMLTVLSLGACAAPAPSGNAPGVKPPTANSGNKPVTGAPTTNELALLSAANKGDNAKVTELLGQGANVNAQNEAGSTALIEAVYANHPETVKVLLDKGADPNLRKKDGATALGFAQKYPAIVELLKSKGAKITSNPALDNELMVASGKGDLAKVKELVEKGAYPNSHNESGSTPLLEAAYNGKADVVKYLLENGADPNARKNDGASAIGFAKKYPAIVDMLKAAGARE